MAGDFRNWRSQGPDANDLVNKGNVGSMLDMVNKWQANRNNGAGGNIGAVVQALGHQKDLKVKLAAIDAELQARKHDSLVQGAVELGRTEQEGVNRVNELNAQGRQTRSTLKTHAAVLAANPDFKISKINTDENTAGSFEIQRFTPAEMATGEKMRNENGLMPATDEEAFGRRVRDFRQDRNETFATQSDEEARTRRSDAYADARAKQQAKEAAEAAGASSGHAPVGNGPITQSYSAVNNDYNDPHHEDYEEHEDHEDHEESSPAPAPQAAATQESREPAPIPQASASTAAPAGLAFQHTKGAGSYEPSNGFKGDTRVKCTWCGNFEDTPDEIHSKHAIQSNGWCQHSLDVLNEVKNS